MHEAFWQGLGSQVRVLNTHCLCVPPRYMHLPVRHLLVLLQSVSIWHVHSGSLGQSSQSGMFWQPSTESQKSVVQALLSSQASAAKGSWCTPSSGLQ